MTDMWFRRRKMNVKETSGIVRPRPLRSWFAFGAESFWALLVLSLTVCCVVTIAILWAWSQRDHYIERMIRQTLREEYPEWNISFSKAELDQRGRLVLADVVVNPNSATPPLCTIQGVRVTVDRDLLLQQHRIDVQSVEVNRPQVTVIREKSGQWNWENLPKLKSTAETGAVPLVKIRDAGIAVQWEHEEFERALRARIDAVDIDLTPVTRHSYRFEGVGREETLGSSRFSGMVDVLHRTWELSGDLKGLTIDQPLLQAAAMISPDADRVVSQLQQPGWGLLAKGTSEERHADLTDGEGVSATEIPATDQVAVQRASHGREQPVEQAFSLKLAADLNFHCSQQEQGEPDFAVFIELVRGELQHPGIPLPLDRIEGQIAIDRLGMRIDRMQLASGRTLARITGAWGWGEQTLPANVPEELLVTLNNYQVTPATRGFLPNGMKTLYDELSPAGTLSIAFGLRRGETREIDFDLHSAEIHEGAIRHQMFSYPVTNLQGTIIRTDHGVGPEAWALQGTGMASGRTVTLTGTVLDPGPRAETVFDISVDRIAIDDQFYRALRPREREILTYLGLQGMADVHCVIVRKLALGNKPIIRLDADIYEASLHVDSFPLGIRQLSGHVNSDETGWQFTRLAGVHGDTRINGFGTVVPVSGEWKLDMTMAAQQAYFDNDLYLAIRRASPEVARVWEMLRPRGGFGLTVNVGWMSGTDKAQVEIPLMKLQNCEIMPTVFPWRISEIDATLAIGRDGVVAFENLKASHDQCSLSTTGTFSPHEKYWQLRFENLVLDDLFPNHELLAALPVSFRRLLESLKLQRPVSLAGKLEFKGDYRGEVVTAAWDAEAEFNQLDVYVGIDLQRASGKLQFQGMLDREGVVLIPKGHVQLDSCWVMGYQVTDVKGPFRVDREQILLGSARMFEPESPEDEWATVSRHERITGRVFGGELFLDLLAKRTTAMPYWLRCTLSRADLEQWAIQSNYGQANIKGEVNGYIDLAGDAVSTRNMVGNGRVLISPAALYELPIIFQMFQSLRFAPVDDAAFRDAYAQFRILDEKFVFDEIGLLGDSMSLFGQGTIRFDRTIDMDFVYRPPRRGSRINLASQVLNRLENVLPVLFTVEVQGTVDLPRIKVQDGVRETLRGFAKMLEMGPGALRPPKVLPPPRMEIQPLPQAAQVPVMAF